MFDLFLCSHFYPSFLNAVRSPLFYKSKSLFSIFQMSYAIFNCSMLLLPAGDICAPSFFPAQPQSTRWKEQKPMKTRLERPYKNMQCVTRSSCPRAIFMGFNSCSALIEVRFPTYAAACYCSQFFIFAPLPTQKFRTRLCEPKRKLASFGFSPPWCFDMK